MAIRMPGGLEPIDEIRICGREHPRAPVILERAPIITGPAVRARESAEHVSVLTCQWFRDVENDKRFPPVALSRKGRAKASTCVEVRWIVAKNRAESGFGVLCSSNPQLQHRDPQAHLDVCGIHCVDPLEQGERC